MLRMRVDLCAFSAIKEKVFPREAFHDPLCYGNTAHLRLCPVYTRLVNII